MLAQQVPERFLHDHPDFKTLLEITSREEEILEPSLVEKDYWIMHVLWGLSAQGLKYELKGEMRTSGLVWREIAKQGTSPIIELSPAGIPSISRTASWARLPCLTS